MFRLYRSWAERLLRIPAPPDPPPGDEDSTRVFQAAPNFFYYLIVRWLIGTTVAFFALVPVSNFPVLRNFDDVLKYTGGRDFLPDFPTFPAFIIFVVAVQRLWMLALLRLDFEKRYYLVTDRSLRVREGVMFVREMTITFANIQNISISQGPIQRLLGIADLQVDTAGGGKKSEDSEGKGDMHGVRFRGVNNAEQIRTLITDRLRELKDSGLGDTDEPPLAGLTREATPVSGLLGPLREILSEATALREAVTAERP